MRNQPCIVGIISESVKLFLHTHAIQNSAKPEVIFEALGHSSGVFTMDVYSHIIEGMPSDAIALLGEVLLAEKNGI